MFTKLRPVFRTPGFVGSLLQPHRQTVISSSSITTANVCYKNFRSPIKFSKPPLVVSEDDSSQVEVGDEDERALDLLINRTFLRPGSGHQVLVIQPVIKWGPKKKRNTTPELQLLEAVTLIKTLREWKVVDKHIVNLESLGKKNLFGKGNLKKYTDLVRTTPTISAVFISVNTLSLIQQTSLQDAFKVPVFDRYTIIMLIFQEHAQTKEAKLQVQLAQLPYLWMVLGGMNEDGFSQKLGITDSYLGGELKPLSIRKEVFRIRKAKLMKQIKELREQRQYIRKEREKREMPVIAVLGYTNAGKTSLIKALTGKESLEPQDYLFATLDVTCHIGELPSGLKVFYVDTLGFISDIPTYLIEAFVTTLEDAIEADVIIHVRDISHPDTVAQNENVLETLQGLNLSEERLRDVITVGNKIDLVEKSELKSYKDLILVSSTDMTGIDVLREEVEKKVLLTTDKTQIMIRVESGGEEYFWLHENSTVTKEIPDPKNSQFMLVTVIISSASLAKFRHRFIRSYAKS